MAATVKKNNYSYLTNAQFAKRILNGEFSDIEERKKILGDRYEEVQELVKSSLISNKKITAIKKGEDQIIQDIANNKWGSSDAEILKKLNLLGYENKKDILDSAKKLQQKKYKEIAESFNSKEITYTNLLGVLEKEKIDYEKIEPYIKERSSQIEKGDYIQIKKGAKDIYTKKTFPTYAIGSKYLVRKVTKYNVVFGDSQQDMGTVRKDSVIKQ